MINAFPCPLVVPDRMYGKIGLRFLYAGMRQPGRVRQATSFSFPAGMRPYGRVSAGLPGSSFPKSSFPAEKPARPAFRGFPRKKPPVRGRETFRYLRQDFAGKGRAVPGYGQAVHFAAMVVKNNRLPRCRRTIPCRKRKTRPSGPGCPMAETGFNREKGERKIPFPGFPEKPPLFSGKASFFRSGIDGLGEHDHFLPRQIVGGDHIFHPVIGPKEGMIR